LINRDAWFDRKTFIFKKILILLNNRDLLVKIEYFIS